MERPCQHCGKPATYRYPRQKKDGRVKVQQRRRKRLGRNDHDLCGRCWQKLMDSVHSQQIS